MSDKPTVVEALNRVMADVGPIGKNRVNDQQKFLFRGIDDVMNALHPALVEHGVLVLPEVQERSVETRQTKGGGAMNVVHLRVRFTFYGPAGDSVPAETWGEAQDSADKATNKAHSAAYKVAMLQALSIPTDDNQDADQSTVEAAPVNPVVLARFRIAAAGQAKNMTVQEIEDEFVAWTDGQPIRDADLDTLTRFEHYLSTGEVQPKPEVPSAEGKAAAGLAWADQWRKQLAKVTAAAPLARAKLAIETAENSGVIDAALAAALAAELTNKRAEVTASKATAEVPG